MRWSHGIDVKFPVKSKSHSQHRVGYRQPKPSVGSGIDLSLHMSHSPRLGPARPMRWPHAEVSPGLPVWNYSCGIPSVLTAQPPQLLSDWAQHSHPVGKGHFFTRDTIEGVGKVADRARPSIIPTLRQKLTWFLWWASSRTMERCDLCSWAHLATHIPILVESQFKETRLALSLP